MRSLLVSLMTSLPISGHPRASVCVELYRSLCFLISLQLHAWRMLLSYWNTSVPKNESVLPWERQWEIYTADPCAQHKPQTHGSFFFSLFNMQRAVGTYYIPSSITQPTSESSIWVVCMYIDSFFHQIEIVIYVRVFYLFIFLLSWCLFLFKGYLKWNSVGKKRKENTLLNVHRASKE